MAFKLFLPLILATAISPIHARIVSSDRPGTFESQNVQNALTSHPQYSYAYNVDDALTRDSKVQHEVRNGDAVRGSYAFLQPDGSRRLVHYTADAINGFNAIVRKQQGSAGAQAVPLSHGPINQPQVSPVVHSPILDHQLPLAPSIYPHQIHSVARPVGHQPQLVYRQPHEPIVSVPTAPAVIRHPDGRHEIHAPKISVPTASAIIRPAVPMLPKAQMHPNVIPYSQMSGTYQPSHSVSHSQAPVFVVQPFTWYGKSHQSGSPINPVNKQPGMLPVVRVPTATVRPPAPAYGKIPATHPNAIQHEQPAPYLNSGVRPVILGRYGYALTNAPFKLKQQ